jgi:hypothetical protein
MHPTAAMDENEQDLVFVVVIHPAAAEVPATATPDGAKTESDFRYAERRC